MKKTYQKVVSMILSVAIISFGFLTVTAQTGAIVGARPITAEAGQKISVPITISGNPGIMGYAFELTYDPTDVVISEVINSDLFAGMFNNSLSTSVPGELKVLWTGVENGDANGELFFLMVEISPTAKDSVRIELSYSQEDTFNENWQDVILQTEDINIAISGHSFGGWIIDKPATKEEEGQRHRECEICGHIEYESIPKLNSNGYQALFEWVRSQHALLQILLWIVVVPLAILVSPFWVFFV